MPVAFLENDRNIWDEPSSSATQVGNNEIRGATLNQLILKLTDEKHHGSCYSLD